jgi:phosphatidylinositol kinase/protein kinase (PI-3  family)
VFCHHDEDSHLIQIYVKFKGEGGDDLRQDAVMEQVFGLVNVVLQRDRQTRKRTLSIRDYKVVPLASQAGVLEFVGNTMPLQNWLFYAHCKYAAFICGFPTKYLRHFLGIDQVT